VAAVGNAAAALNDEHARAGGALLAGDIARLRQVAPAAARFVAIGFSMGATTVSAAAARGADIDDLVMLGSPGASSDVRTAHDYPMLPAKHAYALSYDQDPITLGTTDLLAGLAGSVGRPPTGSSPFGPDPASEDFDAQVIATESNVPDPSVQLSFGPFPDLLGSAIANDVADLAAHHQEPNYYSAASLAAIASVTVGHYGDVPIKPGR
jgi:pimeloyl-ACP methyl ester carboxylesterase